MRNGVFPFAATATLLTALMGHAGMSRAGPDSHVLIRVAVTPKTTVSGYPASVTISLINRSKHPLRFVNSGGAWRFFECEQVGPSGQMVRIPRTRWGRMMVGTLMPLGGPIRPTHQIPAATSKVWGHPLPLARCYDLTLPGTYDLRLLTQRPIYLVNGPIHAYVSKGGNLHAVTTRGSLYLPSFEESVKAFGAAKAIPEGRAYSNLLEVKVLRPVVRQPHLRALASAGPAPEIENATVPKGILLSIVRVPIHGHALPVLTEITISANKKPLKVHLTGNPLIDFYDVQVDGPDGLNGTELAKKPTPHYIPIPNWNSVPLTAYGKWLAKHKLSKASRWRTYTLKQGTVYKYTGPVNLSCRFDMSLPGVYHVRFRLARTHTWSPWAKITVPAR